jgi:hypothetical protein
MRRYLIAVFLFLACATALLAEAPQAEKASRGTRAGKFIRLRVDAKHQAQELETATVRLARPGKDGATVDLVGVVHVGDRGYYEKLNEQLKQYDVVLYELVAEPGTRIPKGGRREVDNPLAFVQQALKLILDLELQTEQIDYTQKHFLHADLSPQQMAEAIRERGDTGLTLFLNIAADVIRQQNLQERKRGKEPAADEAEFDPLGLLLDPEGAVKLKRLMAEQMEALLSPEGGLGPTLGRILIADRNKAALKVLQKQLAKGKKKIAIFYGAAHMPDFEKRLGDEFGFKRQREEWLTAWDLRPKERGLGDLLKLLEP